MVQRESIGGQARSHPLLPNCPHHLCRRPPSLRELKRWAQLAVALGLRGWAPHAALGTAFEQVYVRGEAVEEARLVAAAAYQAHCGDLAVAAWGLHTGVEVCVAYKGCSVLRWQRA